MGVNSKCNSSTLAPESSIRKLFDFFVSDVFFKYLHQTTELGKPFLIVHLVIGADIVSVKATVRKFQHGDYTLLHDADWQVFETLV